MMSGHESYISAVKTFNRFLEQKKLRKTPERFFILKKVWQMQRHFSIEELYDAICADRYHVSRATVYNTVEILLLSGLLLRHQFNPGETVYEVSTGSHIHLICMACGKITEVSDEDSDIAALTQRSYKGFTPQHVSAYIYGVCSSCTSNTTKQQTHN